MPDCAYSGVVQWQDESFWSSLLGFESLPRSQFSALPSVDFSFDGSNFFN